jgi:hypothetical protein
MADAEQMSALNFERELEHVEPTFTVLWRDRIAALEKRDGAGCHYCRRSVHISRPLAPHRPNDATIDHKIPRSKDGTDSLDNLLLACRACNEAKEDRDYEDFLAHPFRLTPEQKRQRLMLDDPRVKEVLAQFPGAKVVSVRERPIRGTLAWAIEQGEVDEAGRYRKAPRDDRSTEPARKMSAQEVAQWLRESAEKKGKPWPRA